MNGSTDLREIELNVALEEWSRLGPTVAIYQHLTSKVKKLHEAGLLNVVSPGYNVWNITLTDAGRERLIRMGVLPGREETDKAKPQRTDPDDDGCWERSE